MDSNDALARIAEQFNRTVFPQPAPGERVANARHEAGLTQQQLANGVGINRVTLARIESGAASPTLAVALNLAARLDTTVEALFAEDVHRLTRMVMNGSWEALFMGTLPLSVEDIDHMLDIVGDADLDDYPELAKVVAAVEAERAERFGAPRAPKLDSYGNVIKTY